MQPRSARQTEPERGGGAGSAAGCAATAAAVAPAEEPATALLLHDLRAAVSDVLGGLRLVDPERLEGDAALQLRRVRAAAEELARLLDDGLPRLLGEAAVPQPPGAALPLQALLTDVRIRWSARARERGLGFVLSAGEGLPDAIAVERLALERILSNLLMNAVNYAGRGCITLAVGVGPDGALRFAVEDEGPGFPPEIVAGSAAARGDGAGSGARGAAAPAGSGLGLRITRDMAARIEGRVILANRPEGGARAELVIPARVWRRVAPAAAAAAWIDLSGARVLVAEDSATNQALLTAMLHRLGAETTVAGDGLEALDRLAEGPFALALIDIEMPRLSGLEVIRRFRSREAPAARLPVLAVTAYVLRANREAIFAAGADGILPKPVHGPEALAQAVAAAIARARAEPSLYAPAPDGLVLDRTRFDRLLELAGPAGARDLVGRLAGDLSAVERGLVRGLGEADAAAVRAQTHVLIALAGAVGASELQRLSEALNGAAHRHSEEAMALIGADVLVQLDHLIHFVSGERGRLAELR